MYSVESSIGFCLKEEGAQSTAKIQLFVRTKSGTCFVKTCLQGISARFSNAINTDGKLHDPLQSTISCLDSRKSVILHNTIAFISTRW